MNVQKQKKKLTDNSKLLIVIRKKIIEIFTF